MDFIPSKRFWIHLLENTTGAALSATSIPIMCLKEGSVPRQSNPLVPHSVVERMVLP
jgi:hypothetical protein